MNKYILPVIVALGVTGLDVVGTVSAAPLPGGTLDPTTIPKYVTPLVIPPVMNNSGTANNFDIAVRQFKQQILPGGIWNTFNGRSDAFPATPIWSYGPDADPAPDSTALGGGAGIAPAANSQFNYPAYTIEATVNTPTAVNWINELVVDAVACKASATPATDPACNYLPHLLPIDRSLHWANPEQLPCMNPAKTKDCRPAASNGAILQQPYNGPVPIVTHVHGSHVDAESDGYPEAWWLPAANNIPAGYATQGSLVNKYSRQTNTTPGVGNFIYRNDQPSATIWYHDHTLGMTRSNVYAGPAGFWLLRERRGGETGLVSGTLPGPAPVYGEDLVTTNLPASLGGAREKYREIPIAIQDRSFNADGSLFYPDNRAFFEGIKPNMLNIPLIGDTRYPSDIAPIWNPEAFFNTMVVNGTTWPVQEVAQALYRFRMLDGCNSRFLNLSLRVVNADGTLGAELPFYQIGAEQSLLPNVVKIESGRKTTYCQNTTSPCKKTGTILVTPTADPQEALLMGLAERADVIVDFRGLANKTVVRMINTAPDAPFGGFPDIPADPGTTGQVMQFVVNTALNGKSPTDPGGATPATAPQNLKFKLVDSGDKASGGVQKTVRNLALLEEESALVCATVALSGTVSYDSSATPDPLNPGTCLTKQGTLAKSVPFAPKAAVLGVNGSAGGSVTLWSDPIHTNPALNATETWELWNWTVDGHPIHLHEIKLKIVNREAFDPVTGALSGVVRAPAPTEAGWKDTIIAYPGEVTRLNATFDIPGLYVWHCHIVEHEDNEMMVPYCVGNRNANGCQELSFAP